MTHCWADLQAAKFDFSKTRKTMTRDFVFDITQNQHTKIIDILKHLWPLVDDQGAFGGVKQTRLMWLGLCLLVGEFWVLPGCLIRVWQLLLPFPSGDRYLDPNFSSWGLLTNILWTMEQLTCFGVLLLRFLGSHFLSQQKWTNSKMLFR